ncbi:MAG TPA: bifunctional nuclease family protein [Armatimonadota bacterium]|nr:bifunctional nuclease family protein [Armatimonadota bacterium]
MDDERNFEEENRPEDEIPSEGLPEFGDMGDMPDRGASEDKRLDEKEVKVVGVYEHQDSITAQPAAFVLLRDNQGRSVLIWIGRPEAYSISVALEGASMDRPMTHDLMKNIIQRLGGTVDRIVIDDLWHETYYAKVHIVINGSVVEIDSRPSDAIALGLRTKAPIYMAESVLEQAAVYEE